MAAYRRVYDLHHLQADCQEPGSAPVIECGLATFAFLLCNVRRVWAASRVYSLISVHR